MAYHWSICHEQHFGKNVQLMLNQFHVQLNATEPLLDTVITLKHLLGESHLHLLSDIFLQFTQTVGKYTQKCNRFCASASSILKSYDDHHGDDGNDEKMKENLFDKWLAWLSNPLTMVVFLLVERDYNSQLGQFLCVCLCWFFKIWLLLININK